jgi:ABC-type multidrug transport system permease subunit
MDADDCLSSRGVFTRGGVLFFMILFNALLALAELTSTFATRPIIIKHKNLYAAALRPISRLIRLTRNSSFYRPAAYALAQVVIDVPAVFVQVTIFTIIVYL